MERHHNAGHKNTRVICWLISLLVLVASPSLAQAAISCGACHGGGDGLTPVKDIPGGTRTVGTATAGTGGQFNGNHGTHLAATPAAAKCTTCHGAAAATYTSSHADYTIQMVSPIMYGTVQSWPTTPSPVLKNCSNVSCHFNAPTDTWGATAYSTKASCGKCHSAAPMTQAHAKHFTAYSTAATGKLGTCAKCHVDYTANVGKMQFQHATSAGRRITVLPAVGYTGGNNLYLTPGSQTFGTCSTLACHSNGVAATPTLWTAKNTAGCDFCHPKANLSAAHLKHAGKVVTNNAARAYGVYTGNISSGADTGAAIQYGFGCSNCHPTDVAKHLDGIIQVEMTKTITSGLPIGSLRAKNADTVPAYSFTTKTCANIYCHSSGFGTPAVTTIGWDKTFTLERCANCHGNSPTTGAHQSHKVGIHYDNIFNGTSGFLGYSSLGNVAHGVATQATTISCNICHSLTVSTGFNKGSNSCSTATCHAKSRDLTRVALLDAADGFKFHVNGKVDVSFKPVKIVSKAQIRDTSFTTYSGIWSRTAGNYKLGATSFDTAKTALSNTMWTANVTQGAGSCANIACHNLRVGQSVTWNQSLTCVDCHSQL